MGPCGTPFGPVFPQGKHHQKEPALDGGDGDFAGFRVAGGAIGAATLSESSSKPTGLCILH